MTITNRTRFAFWQWDQRNRAWMQTNGPGSRADMEYWMEGRVEGARNHGMWGSVFCVLPVREGAPLYPPDQLIALDIEGMSLEIVAEDEAAEVESQPAAVDAAPQDTPVPSGADAVEELLAGMARLRDVVPGTVFGSDAGSDFAVELGEAMRHLRNVGRILRQQA